MKYKVFILDVDGVMTTGHFLYSKEGKFLKIFGPDDSDALALLSQFIEIRFVTGDKKGFDISKKRIHEDMKYQLDLVSTTKRVYWIKEIYDLQEVIYMGDGIFDSLVMKEVGYSIAPHNADNTAKSVADYVTDRSGGNRAVAEACIHILNKFYKKFSLDDFNDKEIILGEWTT